MTDRPKGIAEPPEDLKQIIDKTAGYVAKNGETFETRLLNNSDSREKFLFIFAGDEYHNYYLWKIGRYEPKEGNESITKASNTIEKPPELEFLSELPIIPSLDLQIIKLTALFVAKNGDDYLKKLHDHQISAGNKGQFEFMNSTHSLYPIFQKFITQYRKTIEILSGQVNFPDLFADSYQRAQYFTINKVKKDNEQRELKNRQLKYASIDWQDFTVVGHLEFDDIDKVTELAVPLNRLDLIYRSLEAKTKEIELEKAKVTPTAESEEPVAHMEPVPKGMKIRAAGESRLKKKNKEAMIKCPITGKLIPEAKFDEHIRVLLRDTNYEKEKQNYINKNFKYASNLTNDEVYANIKRLARKRVSPDLTAPEAKRIEQQHGPVIE